ncbi:MAG: T9SS type A sorting domain-containing protein [Bacteroidota bacterium]
MRLVCTSIFVLVVVIAEVRPLFAQQGQIDTTFHIGTGASHITQRLELLYDQSVFAGGDFTSFNGSSFRRLIRLSSNGSSISGWAPHTPTIGGADGPVRSSALQTDGKLLIGGLFNTINGIASKNFARLDTSGVIDSSFNIGTGFNSEVTSIASDGNRIFASGFFSSYKGVSVPGFVCLTMTGDIDTSWLKPSGFIAVESIVTTTGGKVFIGGSFTSYNGVPINRIARLNADGTLDTSFNTGTGVSGGNIQAMCAQLDGKLIIAGSFSAVNGVASGRIARLHTNGSVDATFNAGAGANSNIRNLAIQHNTGKIYIGGDFTTVNGVSQPRIARLLSNGLLDSAFPVGTGVNGTVYSIRIQHDGNVIIGGNFSQYNGITVGKIVRLIGDSSTILPVSFLSFAATKMKETEVLLQWTTAGERNNSHFEIERATDNKYFVRIGSVKGAGNTSTITPYRYEDKPDEQLSEHSFFYRLKQVDNNGRFAYSNIVKVNYPMITRPKMVVFPNPANDEIVIHGVPEYGATIYDNNGSVMMIISGDGTFNTHSFKQGLYFIRSEERVLKLIIE